MVEPLEGRMLLTAYQVTSNNPSSSASGTIQSIISAINGSTSGALNTITFDLPSSEQTIALSSPLPAITQPVDIEGNTQPGFTGTPMVVITASFQGSAALSLAAGSSGSTVQDLVINGDILGDGLNVGSADDLVVGCYVGTNASGSSAVANETGIYVGSLGAGCTIGGTASGDANVISGNTNYGINIEGTSCLVAGNVIGPNPLGTSSVSNGVAGVYVGNTGATIGGTTRGTGNLISGNAGHGIDIWAPCAVEGNKIGTNSAESGALPNDRDGIYVGTAFETIGGNSSGDGNLISGNQNFGINIAGNDCAVEGNRIGTDGSGSTAVANSGDGIYVNALGATIGGTASGDLNLISGNTTNGIDIVARFCLVEGNLIGTNAAGSAALPNNTGVTVAAPVTGVTIGGTTSGDTNLISGNTYDGLDVEGSSCLVEGNLIGTNLAGTAALSNGQAGVDVGASGVTIGGSVSGDTNVISGNAHYGVVLNLFSVVEGNRIGTNAAGTAPLPNGGAGILTLTAGATIGGTASGDANLISGNNDYGIDLQASCVVEGNLIGTGASGTTAVANGAGILVEVTGVTIGGSVSSAANIISGNTNTGIYIQAASCLVEGNLIGTNAAGSAALPNGGNGIYVRDTGATIGGTVSGDGNTISGNRYGIAIEDTPCVIEGNLIGTNSTGTAAVPNDVGIFVDASGATIGGTASGAGNTISGNTDEGLDIVAASCLVEGNLIGTNAAGSVALPNGIAGIYVGDTGATIGGTSSGDGNTISGNRYGISLADTPCVVEGNRIGTNSTGTAAVPNSIGVFVDAPGETIGGTASGAGNLVSGNTKSGLDIQAPACLVEGNWIGTDVTGSVAVPNGNEGIYASSSGAAIGGSGAGAANVISGNPYGIDIVGIDCLVAGNRIGTNAAGTAALPNAVGIVNNGVAATIGGTSATAANTISGNTFDGIELNEPCLVEGNQVGTNAAGSAAVPNELGIVVKAPGAMIGATASGDANVISGNSGYGIMLYASCLVEGNRIGTNAAGTAALPNRGGIAALAPGATIGGTTSGDANLISGNKDYGILVQSGACLVVGNRIGTNAAGTTPLPNDVGITLAASGATIGGTAAGAGNVISGNLAYGIDSLAPSDLVEGNLIGTDVTGTNPVPNVLAGVFLGDLQEGADTIGAPGGGNIIAYNGGPGVASSFGTFDSTIRFNSIFGNGGPGIDLFDNGVTPNTAEAPNNTPVLTAASGGVITGTLNAAPNSTYILDFYANPSGDASPARPQGQTDVGTLTVATNAQGNVAFSFPYTPLGLEPFVTATATSASGFTSEFSAPAAYMLSATGLTFPATAGVPFQGEVASFTTSNTVATSSSFTATINWGDGSASTAGTIVVAPSGFLVIGSHTFTQANPAAPVTVTIDDTLDFLQSTASSVAGVANPRALTTVGHTVNFVAGTLYGGVLASFTDSSTPAIAGEFTATINWGDGSASTAGVVSADGAGFDVTGSHTYNFAGSEPVVVTIVDALGAAPATASATAVVAPVPLTIQPKNFAVTPGTPFTGTIATFTDSNPLTSPSFYTATINWGDGTPSTTGTITGTNPFTVTASHTFNTFQQGTDIVTITITDPNGQTATAVSRAVDPPAADTGTNTSTNTMTLAVEGVRISVPPRGVFDGTVATFTEDGPAEPASAYRATIDWGKGRKTAGMVLGSNGRFVVTARHVFTRFSGSRPVTVTVTDPDGQTMTVSESASEVVRHARVVKVASRGKTEATPHR